MGGPETISFYPDDALDNFGISSVNALFRDGSTLGQYTTQKQQMELLGGTKTDIGEHIGDYLSEKFPSASVYATMHRDGLDVGTFISNGVDQILRYGNNISAWSVPYYPVFGAGACQSVETSVGIYSLMLATPSGSLTSIYGPVNPTVGASIAGSGVAWTNPNNITLGVPTDYATATFAGAGLSQILRASGYLTIHVGTNVFPIPNTAVVQGVQVSITGKQNLESFSDNFSSGSLANYTVVDVGGAGAVWSIVGGQIVCESPGSSPNAYMYFNGFEFTPDQTAAMTVQFTGGNNHSQLGVCVRGTQGLAGGSGYHLEVGGDRGC